MNKLFGPNGVALTYNLKCACFKKEEVIVKRKMFLNLLQVRKEFAFVKKREKQLNFDRFLFTY